LSNRQTSQYSNRTLEADNEVKIEELEGIDKCGERIETMNNELTKPK
jgi:hypothetical protein